MSTGAEVLALPEEAPADGSKGWSPCAAQFLEHDVSDPNRGGGEPGEIAPKTGVQTWTAHGLRFNPKH